MKSPRQWDQMKGRIDRLARERGISFYEAARELGRRGARKRAARKPVPAQVYAETNRRLGDREA